jgi:hypothetical protein
MPLNVFLFLFILAMWAVFAVGYELSERWPIVGRVLEESDGAYFVGIGILALLTTFFGTVGIEIK